MNQIQKIKLEKLKSEAPEDMPRFIKAAKLIDEIIGVSYTGDQLTLKEIKKAVSFEPATKEGKEMKQGILNKAKRKANKGMDGSGTFFID